MRKFFRYYSKNLSILLILITIGCSSGVPNGIVRLSPLVAVAPDSLNLKDIKIQVPLFEDLRVRKAIGIIDDQELEPAEDVRATVRFAVEDALRSRGAEVTSLNSFIVSGDIKDWYIIVKPGGWNRSMTARAEIKLNVASPKGKYLYEGNYRGVVNATRFKPSRREIEDLLRQAMMTALDRGLSDGAFMSSLEIVTVD
jgi:uncharacterized lipoprotein YajG